MVLFGTFAFARALCKLGKRGTGLGLTPSREVVALLMSESTLGLQVVRAQVTKRAYTETRRINSPSFWE